MQRIFLTITLFAVFVTGRQPYASAQSGNPEERRGSNYDPPPPPLRVKPEPPPPEAARPLFAIQELDWTDKATWLKLALLIGSIALARRAFRQMKDDY